MYLIDPVLRTWKCPVCEHLSATPFKIHKLDDELFKRVFDRLGEENRIERLRIYNNISDQKRSYAEKAEVQMHQVLREQRTKADAIRSKLRSIVAEINADQMAIQQLIVALLKFKQLGDERARQFEAEIEQIKSIIGKRTEEQQKILEEQYAQMKDDMNKNLDEQKLLEREEDRKKYEMQKQMLETLNVMKNITVAQADRQKLLDRSNWNPGNWGYNLNRSFVKVIGVTTGRSELDIAGKLPLN